MCWACDVYVVVTERLISMRIETKTSTPPGMLQWFSVLRVMRCFRWCAFEVCVIWWPMLFCYEFLCDLSICARCITAQPHWAHFTDVIAFDADYSPPATSFRSKPHKKRTTTVQTDTIADLKSSLAAASKLGAGPLGMWGISGGVLLTRLLRLCLCTNGEALRPSPSATLVFTI